MSAIQLNPQFLEDLLSIFTRIDRYDLLFVLAAMAFNLLIVAIFVAQKKERPNLVRRLGILWLFLAIPLSMVCAHYWRAGREVWVMICFGFIFLYMAVELLLDHVLKIEFRRKWSLHIPYIILEYIALFGLIGISFAIDRTWGMLVSISFWAVLAGVIYLYAGRRKPG